MAILCRVGTGVCIGSSLYGTFTRSFVVSSTRNFVELGSSGILDSYRPL